MGPLPDSAAEYCSEYMNAAGISEYYNKKYDANSDEFWKSIKLNKDTVTQYICIGVKASSYFMPPETLSDKGPGGGGWIVMNKHLQVVNKGTKELWGDGRVFAVGDCNYGCVENDPSVGGFWMPPIPKISYPGEEQCLHACKNIERVDHNFHSKKQKKLKETWWPWGAGMFATSLGPHDACFVLAANEKKCSGYMVNWWIPAALQKEVIETTKIDECRHGLVGRCIWFFVHHTPLNFFGRGPFIKHCQFMP